MTVKKDKYTVDEIKASIDIVLREPTGRYMYEQRVRFLESYLRKIKLKLDNLVKE